MTKINIKVKYQNSKNFWRITELSQKYINKEIVTVECWMSVKVSKAGPIYRNEQGEKTREFKKKSKHVCLFWKVGIERRWWRDATGASEVSCLERFMSLFSIEEP